MNVVNSKETKKNLVSKEHEGFFLLNIFLSLRFQMKGSRRISKTFTL